MQFHLLLRLLPGVSQVLFTWMHIQLIGVLKVGVTCSLTKVFRKPASFCQVGKTGVSEQVRGSINASLVLKTPKKIVHLSIRQRLACTRPSHFKIYNRSMILSMFMY